MKNINIILDTSDPQRPVFVEIEDEQGRSIKIEEWHKLDGDMHAIRIAAEQIQEYEN